MGVQKKRKPQEKHVLVAKVRNMCDETEAHAREMEWNEEEIEKLKEVTTIWDPTYSNGWIRHFF